MRRQAPVRSGRRPRVVITGASAGVGRAAAMAFARRGWAVALIGRGLDRLESAAVEVESLGGEALIFGLDVADAAAVNRAAERVTEAWGGFDVWVNNAMTTVYAPVEEVSPDEFARVTAVTYLGQVHGTLAALRQMRRQGSGAIVQVGSALAYRSIPLQSAYCAAKAAGRAFTDSLRSELIRERSPVRLSIVHLPAVATAQFGWARSRMPRKLQPVPPIHSAEVAAEAIVRAARESPRELWVGRPTMMAILGTSLAPGLLDRLVARSAWDGQMTADLAEPRPDNLDEPVPGPVHAAPPFERVESRALTASDTVVRAAAAGLGVLLVGAVALVARTAARPAARDRLRAERTRSPSGGAARPDRS